MTPPDAASSEHHQVLRDAVTGRMAADREAADFPAEQLDAIGVALARRTARSPGANVGGRLRELERAADIDVEPPVASERRAGRGVKVAVAKLTNWHVGYLATQVRDLGNASVRVVRALASRVDELERRVEELERLEQADAEVPS
ncbi:MAG TPA: hypothetical protein VLR27_12400 [Acidimicrobiales bacterium]|nr:hypothetical protein [Acidimicrobiales bacterium]